MPTALYLTPKMGLIPEVSTQNYGSLAKALREYVANAVDAKAKNVWITFSRDPQGSSTLDIRDDGIGMTLDDLSGQFLAVGGSRKYDDPATIGRIGIGFLAVVPLCEGISIYTKAKDEVKVIEASIDTSTMLPQEVRFEEIAKKQIGTARVLNDEDSGRLVQEYGDSFTAFSLRRLRGDVVDTFGDPEGFHEFTEELRRILPLPWPRKGPLQSMVSESLWALMNKKAAGHCLNVFLNDPKTPLTRRVYGENVSRENVLYVQEFREEVIVPPSRRIGQTGAIRITGFLVCDEPSNEPKEGRKLSGIITRVLNVAVDEETFFGLEGKEERKKRVAGEIFIEGLDANRAIQINRNAFTETHKPVQVFREQMRERISAFFSGMNRIWRARSIVNREVRRIREVVEGVNDALEAIGRVTDGLSQGRRKPPPALMQHAARRHFALEATAGGVGGLKVKVADDVSAAGKSPYRIELEGDPHTELRGVVHVSKQLVDVRAVKFNIGGTEFGLRVVSATKTDPPCAIDLFSRVVVLNERHPLVAKGDKSVIEVVVFLAYAVEMTKTARELAAQVTQLMTEARS